MKTDEVAVSIPFLETEEWNEERESFIGNEDRFPSQCSKLRMALSNAWFISGMLIALFLGLVIGYLSRNLTVNSGAQACLDSAVPRTFQEEPIYSEPPSDASNAAWSSLIPSGRGFVEILHGDSDTIQEGRYCVSVFHQLHCLDLLRRGYYEALEMTEFGATPVAPDGGPVSPIPGDFGHSAIAHVHVHNSSHMHHCFDYLRQALICAADSTLEEKNDTIAGVRGWDTVHQCRDFAALKDWAEKHKYSDSEGITN